MKIFQYFRKNYRYFIGMDSKLFPFYGKFDSFHKETVGKDTLMITLPIL